MKKKQRKKHQRRRIKKTIKGRQTAYKSPIFTFFAGFLFGLTAFLLLILGFFATKPSYAFALTNNNLKINQCVEIQSLCYGDSQLALASISSTNLHIRIIPSRRLVVDGKHKIIEIYSNTGQTDKDFKIFASYYSSGSEDIELTPEILTRYQQLEPEIDWSKTGLVYQE